MDGFDAVALGCVLVQVAQPGMKQLEDGPLEFVGAEGVEPHREEGQVGEHDQDEGHQVERLECVRLHE